MTNMIEMITNAAAMCLVILMYSFVGYVVISLIKKVINDIVRNVAGLKHEVKTKEAIDARRYDVS